MAVAYCFRPQNDLLGLLGRDYSSRHRRVRYGLSVPPHTPLFVFVPSVNCKDIQTWSPKTDRARTRLPLTTEVCEKSVDGVGDGELG